MKIAALITGVALAAVGVDAEAAGRFRPATADYVVLRVPSLATQDPIALLEKRVSQEPSDEAIAAELARLYLERARVERQQRYFARAETLVKPWARRADANVDTLRVQADILQNRHEFAAAITLLDRAIMRSPQDAGARLMRASVKLVQGRPTEARADCAAVLASGESTVGTICLAQVLGATGGLARADALLKTLLSRELASPKESRESMSSATRGWALWVMADFADRSGDAAAAEKLLRAAIEAAPENEGIRSALSDLLLAGGASREALVLVDLPAPSVGLLARRARAQHLLRDESIAETHEQIDEIVALARRRGDSPHLREEALVALEVDGDTARALDLAKANFETQRETIDVRLLVRAAQARGDVASLQAVEKWIQQTGYEDHALAGLKTPRART